jgi:hypothetical protein
MDLKKNKQDILEILYILWENNIWEFARPLAIIIYYSEEINKELLDIISNILNKALLETNDLVKIKKIEEAQKSIISMTKNEEKDNLEDLNKVNNLLNKL